MTQTHGQDTDMKRCALLVLILAFSVAAYAQQGTPYQAYAINSSGQPAGGATIRICTSVAVGTPCSPLAQIYRDINLTVPISNPTTADPLGNFYFYAVSAVYQAQVSGAGITTYTYPIATPVVANVSNTWTAAQIFSTANSVYLADSYASGSTTGGIQEAYTACQNGPYNSTGCHVVLGSDAAINGNGVVTVIQKRPLYIDLQGHSINTACNSGPCLMFNAQIGGASETLSIEHGRIEYTGVSGPSITSALQIVGTDYAHLNDLIFGPENGSSSAAALLTVANFDDSLFENLAFLNNTGSPMVLGAPSSGCLTPATILHMDNVSLHGNGGPVKFTGCSNLTWVRNSDWTGNPSQTLVDIDFTGNIATIKFEDDDFAINGDGTSFTNIFNIHGPTTKAFSQFQSVGNSFFAGSQGSLGTVYNFSGAAGGSFPNFNLTMRNNLYSGPFGNLQQGWQSNESTTAENEQFSGWTPAQFGDVIINSQTSSGASSGAVGSNGYFYDLAGSAQSGFIRIGSSDTVNFRNHAGTADVTGLSKNTSDQFTIGNTTPPGSVLNTGRVIFQNQTTVSLNGSCTGDFSFSAGWNTPGTCVVANDSKDQAGLITWVPGSSPGANPSVTLTFHDGAFSNRPFCQGWFQQTGNVAQSAGVQGTSSTMTFDYNGTPPAGPAVMQLQWLCLSGGNF